MIGKMFRYFAILAAFQVALPAFSQVCSDRTCPPIARYQISCHTNLLSPLFYSSFDLNSIYKDKLLFVSYGDGRDLSFNPKEFRIVDGETQMMRGSVSDLKPRLAHIKMDNNSDELSTDIFVQANEWECTFYDHANSENYE